MSPAQRVGLALGAFNRIRLPLQGQREIHQALDEKRFAGLSAPDEAKGGVQILAPVGSGKTVGAETYRDVVNGQASPGTTPALLATLDTSGSARSVPAAILRAMGEPRPDRGNETLLWMRARAGLEERGVEILILDEMDRAARRPAIANHIAGALRDLADERIVPLAFLCTEKSRLLFRNCPDLDERLDAPVVLHPFDWLISEDREAMIALVNGFDAAIVELGILVEPSGLADPAIVEKLALASGGVLRQIKFIIGTALANVVRRGATQIRILDLRDAVDEYCIAKGFVKNNPFEPDV